MCLVLERLDEIEAERRRLTAEFAELLGEVEAAGRHVEDGCSSVRSWVQHRYSLSNAEAAGRIRELRAAALTEVAEAFGAAEVSACAVRELGRAASNPRCGDRLVEVIEPLLEVAREQRHVDLRTVVRQWERLADAEERRPIPRCCTSGGRGDCGRISTAPST